MRALEIHGHSVAGVACLLATLLAGALMGWAVAFPASDLRFVFGCIAVAVPVGLAMAGIAAVEPGAALLAAIEVLAFSTALLVRIAVRGAPDAFPIAMLSTVIVGSAAVLWRRATPSSVVVALVAGYVSAALIYEVGIPLHRLF